MNSKQLVQKLCLGTVQFGLDYGISNTKGRVEQVEIRKILQTAHQAGITVLDTASQYGCADEIIGKITHEEKIPFDVMAKSPKFEDEGHEFEHVRSIFNAQIDLSLHTLKVNSIDVFYIRNLDALLKIYGEEAITFFDNLKKQDKVRNIGISVYDRGQIDDVLKVFTPDAVQIPFGVLDQRLKADSTLSLLQEKGVDIHVRSIFTQGLVFMNPNDLPSFFDPVKSDLQKIHQIIDENDLSPLQAAVYFVLQQPEISRIIFGVTSTKELKEILDIARKPIPKDIDWSSLAIYDDHVLNPQNWGK